MVVGVNLVDVLLIACGHGLAAIISALLKSSTLADGTEEPVLIRYAAHVVPQQMAGVAYPTCNYRFCCARFVFLMSQIRNLNQAIALA